MTNVVLLGPQRFIPTLGEAVAAAGISGRLASVTAGWQEREEEDRELHEHLGERTVNLMLYARSEDVFERDAELFAAHRERQDRLRALQELYRLRLHPLMEAARALLRREGDAGLLDPEREEAIEALRQLDRHHLARIAEIHAGFERRMRPADRPAVVRHLTQLSSLLERTEAVAIAGGNVAILLNRLRLFALARFLGGRTVFAWSAGAMSVSERIVLFHDSPPHGPGDAEILDAGLALVPGVVPLPHARRRLALEDGLRVGLFARRFAPARALAFDDGARLFVGDDAIAPIGVRRLASDGTLQALAGAGPTEAA